ncbi:MAG: glycine--tRNA ligase [Rhodospirillales bacterium]|nr:glycine--tRNA ligase [Rhodospirillales bacterium]MCB9973832.1 glycine--tRNA ligase [Rhodospirillales bacterium]
MKDIVALCKRRGFIFPASDIYGGINGFWDYGPLGTELKNNIRDLWWKSMVLTPPLGPDGEPVQIVGLDSAIIQNPKCWEASGHVGGFNDPMVDCKESKKRYRADHVTVLLPKNQDGFWLAFDKDAEEDDINQRLKKLAKGRPQSDYDVKKLDKIPFSDFSKIIGPDAKEPGTLTEPRQFNMMFYTFIGAMGGEENKAYLRPETCAGIFLNFKNVLDSSRVKVPFGIAQIGKAFRNEVTPRNFIFRSREFEQMELEWFCEKEEAPKWFEFWVEQRKKWWDSVGIDLKKCHFLDVPKEDLAHYSDRTIDIEYQFPFSAPEYDELEGIAHRGNFDLTQHQTFSGTKLEYMDPTDNTRRFLPDVIEPSCGLTRAVLAVLSEAYTLDETRPSGVYLNFPPAVAPKKAAILPLTAKEEHVPIAQKLYMELREDYAVDLDIKQNIGKRYARQDEIGTPYCFTVDNDTVSDQTVTVRDRNTMAQERIGLDHVADFLRGKMHKKS